MAFNMLRRIIPSMPSDKMSKIHTLRIATDYIAFLDEVCFALLFSHLECHVASTKHCEQILAFQMSSDESAFDTNGFNLQTSFNIWRSGKVQQQLHANNHRQNSNSSAQNPSSSNMFNFYSNQPAGSNSDSSASSSIKSGKLLLLFLLQIIHFFSKVTFRMDRSQFGGYG